MSLRPLRAAAPGCRLTAFISYQKGCSPCRKDIQSAEVQPYLLIGVPDEHIRVQLYIHNRGEADALNVTWYAKVLVSAPLDPAGEDNQFVQFNDRCSTEADIV